MSRSLILSAAVALGLGAALPAAAQAQEGYGYYTPYYYTYPYSSYSYTPGYSTYSYTPSYYYTPTYYYSPSYADFTARAYVPWTVPTYVPAPTTYRPTYLDPAYGYYYNPVSSLYQYYPAARSVYYSRGAVIYR